MMLDLLFMLIAYLCGSVSSGILICKLMGLPDPRSDGSKNPGTTNVLRLGSKKAALITLLGDVLKGTIPVLIAMTCGVHGMSLGFVALSAFLGHLYPIFFGFKGGKGVATLLGCLLALSWVVAALALLTWIIIAALTRYSSLAALIACLLVPVYDFFITNQSYTLPLILMTVFVYWRHRGNIERLLTGKESKIGQKKS